MAISTVGVFGSSVLPFSGSDTGGHSWTTKRVMPFLLIAFLSLAGCHRSTDLYNVVERKESESKSSFQPWVKLLLRHDGRNLNARCNNYKAAPNTDQAVPCNLRAGDVIKCQAFDDRMSDDAGGYDLICGDDREDGKVLTSAKNELLQIEEYDAAYEARRKRSLTVR